MIGLHRLQACGKHADQQRNSKLEPNRNHTTNSSIRQHEQVFRANLVRIPSKAGSPLVNLSQYAQQQQQNQQQQQQQQRKQPNSSTARATTTGSELLSGHIVEAVAGRSVMIAEPVQRPATAGRHRAVQDQDVLLLIDEHSGEAPIVISQRMSATRGDLAPSGGGRTMSKTRQQLELLCAAADYTSLQGRTGEPDSGTIILAPVVVGRRSHRMQQALHQQQQIQHQKQHQARYLFGELGSGVELRQHVLRPIGVVEQIPTSKQLTSKSSDGSRRSTSSSSSSSAASSSNVAAEQRRQRLTKRQLQLQHQQHNSVSLLDIAANVAEYRLYEGTRFDAVPEYAVADDSHVGGCTGRSRRAPIGGSGGAKSGKPKQANKQQQSCCSSTALSNCDISSTYCCSDPSCQYQAPPPVNYAEKPKVTVLPLMKPAPSCQKIVQPGASCCSDLPLSAHHHLIDHHFCQANSHSPHPSYLPPLNQPNAVVNQQQQVIIMNGRTNVISSCNNRKSTAATGSHSSPNGSQTSVTSSLSSDPELTSTELMYESLAAELKAKLGNPQIGPILLPPRDYDTLCRKQGKLDGIDQRRSTNPQLVGPILAEGSSGRPLNESSSSENGSPKFNN